MATKHILKHRIVELLRAYPVDPSDSLLQAGLNMEFGIAASKGRIRRATIELAKAGRVDISPEIRGGWRYRLAPLTRTRNLDRLPGYERLDLESS